MNIIRNILYIILIIIITVSCRRKFDIADDISIFRYNESSGITSLDPAYAKDQANIWATSQMFNGLVQLDENLIIKPCIAKSWSISDDGLLYTFHLKDDVFFHKHQSFASKEERRLKAKDFVYTFNRLIDKQTASPGAWVMNQVAKINSSEYSKLDIIALDDTTLTIKLTNPFPPFLGLLSMTYCAVVPQKIVKLYEKDFRENPIGTGPFVFKMWKEGVRLVLLKNDEYFEFDDNENPLPYLDAINITFIIDKQTEFLEFIKDNLDFISGLAINYKDELLTPNGLLNPKHSNKVNLIRQHFLNTEYLGFLIDSEYTEQNPKDNPLMLKEVRQAINYGFDRRKMIRYLRNNVGMPGEYGFIPPGLPSFDSSAISYSYNPDKARSLLKEAGFPNGQGMPEITLSTTSEYVDLCEFIQHQLSKIGIKLKLEVNQAGTLREMIAQSKLVFFRASWIADYPDAENYFSLFYTPNFCPNGPNYTHFSNSDFDLMYKNAISEPNDSVRYSYYHKMNKLIMEEAPVVILYYDQVMRFTRKNISGLDCNAMNMLILKKVKKT